MKKEIVEANAALRKSYSAYKTTNAVANPNTAMKALLITQKKDWRDAQKVCRGISIGAFSLFRRLLDGTAKEQWDILGNEVHNDVTHTDRQGLTVAGPRGKSWATLELCIEKHKLLVFHLDAADVTRRYLQQGIRKPFDVKVKWFMQRVSAINRDLTLMPCLALNTQTSAEIVPTNVPFNGAELCGIIIRSLPQDWQSQYRVSNGQINQTKPQELLIQLEAIEKIMDQKRKEKESSKKASTANPGKTARNSEKRKSTGSGDSFRIPKKQRSEKFCNRCKDNGGAHTTHNTSDCNRYKADGTPNKDYGARSSSTKGKDGKKDKPYYKKGGGDTKSISHLTAALDKMKKQMKKMKKSSGKKRKRHSRHQSSDSSSSSGSDSE